MSSVEDVEPLEHDRLHPAVRRELERETTVAHGGEGVYEMVDAIAAQESTRSWLLGLSPAADRVLFYSVPTSTVVSYPYPPRAQKFWDSKAEAAGGSMRRLEAVIAEREWGWLHPRWRWLQE